MVKLCTDRSDGTKRGERWGWDCTLQPHPSGTKPIDLNKPPPDIADSGSSVPKTASTEHSSPEGAVSPSGSGATGQAIRHPAEPAGNSDEGNPFY